jgi:hypothetical protein
MPIIQGGPPEWVYERVAHLLKWELVPATTPHARPVYELRLKCGLEILRLQFFTKEELQELHQVLEENKPDQPDELRSPAGGQTVVSNPDFVPGG